MIVLQRVLSLPFPFLRSRVKRVKEPLHEQKAQRRHPGIAKGSDYSWRFRLENGCANYRSIHFPR